MSAENIIIRKTESVQFLEALASLKSEDIGTPKERKLRKKVVASLTANPYHMYGIGNAFPPYMDEKEFALLAVGKSPSTRTLFSDRLQDDPDVLIQGCSVSTDNILCLMQLHEQMFLLFGTHKDKFSEISQNIRQVLATKPQRYLFDALSKYNDTNENYPLEKEECRDYMDWIIDFLDESSLSMCGIKNPVLQEVLDEELTRKRILSIEKSEVKPPNKSRKFLTP